MHASLRHERTYRFADHSPRTATIIGAVRRSLRAPSKKNAELTEPSFKNACNRETFVQTFLRLKEHNGQAPGIDGICYSDLSVREVGDIAEVVLQVIERGDYVPSRTLAKIVPKKGGSRTLQIGTVVDRVVAAAVAAEITPYLDKQFLPNLFGFRASYDRRQALLAIMENARRNEHWVVGEDDIRQAFDHVPIVALCDVVRRHIKDSRLVDLIERIVRGHQRNNRKRGIDQGNPLSPVLLNLLLWEHLDRPLTAAGAPPSFRYADNLVLTTKDVAEGELGIQRLREGLRPLGMELKGGTRPLDLRRKGAKIEILGFRVGLQGGEFQLELGKTAWQRFREALRKAQNEPNPAYVCRAVAKGWLIANAPAFENADVREVIQTVYKQACSVGAWELDSKGEWERALEQANTAWREYRLVCRNIPAQVCGHMELCMAIHAGASRAMTRVPDGGYACSLAARMPTGRFFS